MPDTKATGTIGGISCKAVSESSSEGGVSFSTELLFQQCYFSACTKKDRTMLTKTNNVRTITYKYSVGYELNVRTYVLEARTHDKAEKEEERDKKSFFPLRLPHR